MRDIAAQLQREATKLAAETALARAEYKPDKIREAQFKMHAIVLHIIALAGEYEKKLEREEKNDGK